MSVTWCAAASRSGCRWPWIVLALPCRLNPGPQQVTDGAGAGPVTLAGQLARQRAGRLSGPPQRRHQIAALLWLRQGQQRRAQPRDPRRPRLRPRQGSAPSPAVPPRSPAQQRPRTPWPRGPGGPGRQPDPAIPQRPGLRPGSSRRRSSRCGTTASNSAASIHAVSLVAAHITSARRIPESYSLSSGKLSGTEALAQAPDRHFLLTPAADPSGPGFP
jgi:hypothetical protein